MILANPPALDPMPNPTDPAHARVLLVQWAGDYREAYHRLTAGGPETYHAQRHAVTTAGELARAYGSYGVLCLTSADIYDEVMPNGVRALGAAIDPRHIDLAPVLRQIEAVRPTHLVVTTPQVGLFAWALTQGIELLPQLADTFVPTTAGLPWLRRVARRWRHARYCRQLARLLNDPRVRWVGNHNVNACRDLVRIGVAAHKVVPWDWPPQVRPDLYPPKLLDSAKTTWELLYVGSVEPAKGVGDAVGATAELLRRGRSVSLRVIGRGDAEPFRRQALTAGIDGAVRFDGLQPHSEVVTAMRAADVVLVPSRHEYAEGLPMTIYETLATRTPLVCSDHPAFRNRVGDGVSALCVPERSPVELATAVERLMTNADLYRRMSEASAMTWARLVCPVTYYELIRRWVRGSAEDDRWLAEHSVGSGRYG
jgi:glycosyltransferase involved in cell wall biosynthesis